MQEFNN
jgi:NAD kinase